MSISQAIVIENLTKVYNFQTKPALDNINLSIPKGSIFALLGPNGAGKSTLINILAGTVIKNSGKILVNDIDLDDAPQKVKYEIGIVPQEITLDTFFPVKKALDIYAGYFGIRPKDRKTDEILSALGLTNKAYATPKQLSGGMKRRFLVAKSMVHSPPILVLDEPTAGVDIELRDQLWNYVKHMNSQGTTIILTTHYLAEAEALCDHVAFINHGKIILSDRKTNLIKQLGQKKLILKLSQMINQGFELKLNGASTISIKDNVIELKINDEMINISQIVEYFSKNNMQILDIDINELDFEEIFKQVICSSK